MFFSLVIGILAGLGASYVTGPLSDLVKSQFELNEREAGIASFGAVLLVAALVGAIFSSGTSAFWLVLGGLLGAFGLRLFSMAQSRTNEVMAAKKSLADDAAKSASDAAEDVADTVEEAIEDVVSKTK